MIVARGAGLVGLAGALALMVAAGCGGSGGQTGSEDYPIAETTPPETQPPVTTPNGAVVTLPALPTTYAVEPSPTCERAMTNLQNGTQRLVVVPPAPGLRAVAVTEHTTRLEWSFRDLPDDCRPTTLLLAVVNGSDVRATPTVERHEIDSATGSVEITYPDFLPAPNVARASAYMDDGHRSRTISVLIARPADTPPDPPDPTPPVTAPAREPIACDSRATVVEEAAGDVLRYAPGDPPTRVSEVTPVLSGIDLTRARVQVDGRTVCATFTFVRPPANEDFGLRFNLSDTTEASCCASLEFRSTGGRLEVGYFFIDGNGVYQLEPIPDAGASLSGPTLRISGTLPPPERWQHRARRMPETANLAWSVTTHWYSDKYGPYFGDWLPRHEPVGQPAIRHRDGAIVVPGRS